MAPANDQQTLTTLKQSSEQIELTRLQSGHTEHETQHLPQLKLHKDKKVV